MFCTACGFSLKSVMEGMAEPVAAAQPVEEAPAAPEPVYAPPVQEPVYQEPVYAPPVQEPVYQEPVYAQPVQEPVYQAPGYQEPVYASPAQAYAPPQGGYVPPQGGYAPAQGYGASVFNNVVVTGNVRPALQLPTGRSWVKMVFLGLITLGIYNTVVMSRIAQEINITSCRTDGKRTISYFGASLLGLLTLLIYPIVWQHKLCNRIGDALQYRGINYKFSASTMWLWGVLGSLILVGPFIYMHKFMKSMNLVNGHYNING